MNMNRLATPYAGGKSALGQIVVRVVWMVVALAALTIAILSIPRQVAMLGKLTDEESLGIAWFGGIPQGTILPFERLFDIIYLTTTMGAVAFCFGLAVLLYVRQFHERTAMLTSFFLLLYGAIMAGPLESLLTSQASDLILWAYKAQGTLWMLGGVSLLLVFPDGQFVPRWTRWFVPVLIAWTLPTVIGDAFNPLVFNPANGSQVWILVGWFAVPSLIAIYAQIYRYRRQATELQRLQVRWAASGFAGWLLAGSLVPMLLIALFSLLKAAGTNNGPVWVLLISIGRLVWPVGLALPPITLSVAVLKYRLYDIDLIIRRTFVFTILSTLLGLVYVGSIVLFQRMFQSVIGQHSPLAIVTSTLLIVVLFAPLRRRVQNFIDRRFYRQKYNAQHTLDTFSEIIRDEVDPDHLTAELLAAVETTLQPEHVALWLRDPRR